MGAYDYMSEAVNGLKWGLDSYIEGGWVCKDSNGLSFGQPVFGYVDDETGAYAYYNDTAKVAYDADFVTSNSIAFSVNGVAITPVVFATDHATTMAALIAAVEALTGVEAVLDSTDANGRTLLVRTRGAACTVVTTVTLGASQAVATITYASGQVFLGVAMFVQKEPVGYAQYEAVNIIAEGGVYVTPVGNVEANETAYVDNSGAGLGYFTNSAAGAQVGAVYRSTALSGALAKLWVSGQYKMTYASRF